MRMNVNSLYWLKKDIVQIEDQIKELTVIKASAIASMPSGNTVSSEVERFAERLESLQEKLVVKLRKYTEDRDEIEQWIDDIEDDETRVIARMRFIDNCGYQEIGDKLFIHRTTAEKKLRKYLEERNEKDD